MHCTRCGQPTERRVPAGDDKLREVCGGCGEVHYHNPRVVVGTVVLRGGQVLLARRAIQPRVGYWTMPAGFLELGESSIAGATRETREETGVECRVVAPLAHFDILRIGQIYMIYWAELVSEERLGHADTASESLECRWFDWADVPWDALAFDATRYALERARDDVAAGVRQVHFGVLRPVSPDAAGPWRTTNLEDARSFVLAAI